MVVISLLHLLNFSQFLGRPNHSDEQLASEAQLALGILENVLNHPLSKSRYLRLDIRCPILIKSLKRCSKFVRADDLSNVLLDNGRLCDTYKLIHYAAVAICDW